jgi:DNA-binding HxlR family transcriptional regulator
MASRVAWTAGEQRIGLLQYRRRRDATHQRDDTAMTGRTSRYARSYTCPVRLTLDVVGGKWKAHILWELRGGARGFNALLAAVTGISHKVLTQQLRQLERDGLIERRVRATRAHRTDYALTPFGRTLRPSLDALARWAKAHHEHLGAPLDWPTRSTTTPAVGTARQPRPIPSGASVGRSAAARPPGS